MEETSTAIQAGNKPSPVIVQSCVKQARFHLAALFDPFFGKPDRFGLALGMGSKFLLEHTQLPALETTLAGHATKPSKAATTTMLITAITVARMPTKKPLISEVSRTYA